MSARGPLFPLMRFVHTKGRIFPYFRIGGEGAKETPVASLQNLTEYQIVAKRRDPVFLKEYRALFKEALAARAHAIVTGKSRQMGVFESALAAEIPLPLIMEGIEEGLSRAEEEKNS